MIDCKNEKPNVMRQVLTHRGVHTTYADVVVESGGTDSAPGPHDYFDAALAGCKTLTALVYAKSKGIPLESVESHVERDASKEREGTYTLRVKLAFHGAQLTDEHRTRLYNAVSRCPLHKLMTVSDVIIETAPL